jgi:hypothetical protein
MEPMTAQARRTGMMNQRRIRGLATAGLLCAAVAGCGTAAATTTPAGAGAPPAAPTVGCASVNRATSVTVQRHLLVAAPVNGRLGTVTQRHAKLVRALFGDFCAAVNHPEIRLPVHYCPADFGTSFTGTFYDGQQVLATFAYDVGGCPWLSVTAAGKTKATRLLGTAAAAAPHLKADLAAVLGVPVSQVYGSPGSPTTGSVQPGM